MSNIKLNIIANYAGSIWSALMGLAFVPLYIKFMGIESYGLVGFFGTLITMFSILDMGLGVTLSREMARRSVLLGQGQSARDLLRTVELIYWLVAMIIGATVVWLSYYVAQYWVKPEKLSVDDVQQAVMIMGLVTVLRWPFGMYQGGLMGLQKQVLVNTLNAISGTFRGVGSVLVLWLISPTIQAYFSFQIVVSACETFTSAYFLWNSLPQSERQSRFQLSTLHEIWRFAAGMMGINIVSLILGQSDKIILSKMLTLEMYGYYMLAWTVGGALSRLVMPIRLALFPMFSQFVAARDDVGITFVYHKSCQLVSVMVLPIASVLGLFSYEVFLLWTSNPEIAAQTHLVASLIIVGTTCNAMMNLPYAVQLAYGWTSLDLWLSVVFIMILIPLLILLVNLYGMIGGGITWALLNIGYVLINVRIMHGRILKGELSRWYLSDLALPFGAALAPALIGKLFWGEPASKTWMLIYLSIITFLSYASATAATPLIRQILINFAAKSLRRLSMDYARIFG